MASHWCCQCPLLPRGRCYRKPPTPGTPSGAPGVEVQQPSSQALQLSSWTIRFLRGFETSPCFESLVSSGGVSPAEAWHLSQNSASGLLCLETTHVGPLLEQCPRAGTLAQGWLLRAGWRTDSGPVYELKREGSAMRCLGLIIQGFEYGSVVTTCLAFMGSWV